MINLLLTMLLSGAFADATKLYFGESSLVLTVRPGADPRESSRNILSRVGDEGTSLVLGSFTRHWISTESDDDVMVVHGRTLSFADHRHTFAPQSVDFLAIESGTHDHAPISSHLPATPALRLVRADPGVISLHDPTVAAGLASQAWGYRFWIRVRGTDEAGEVFETKFDVRGPEEFGDLFVGRSFDDRCAAALRSGY